MKTKFISILMLSLIILNLNVNVVEASEKQIIDISKGATYLSTTYYEKAQELVLKYPNILHLEVLGYSVDQKPIYVLVMTENVQETIQRDDFNVYRMHYLIEAGTHGRETVNPFIVLKMIEDYAIDYYNDNHIKEFNVNVELSTSVIHFIPLLNPDGHDLAKVGVSSVITEEGKKIISSIKDKNYPNWKANLRGVDINRNFPDRYLDKNINEWVDKWQLYPNSYVSYEPSGAYYSGPYAGSEPETQILMQYMTKYDFRNYITYHSRGKVFYFDWYYAPDGYNEKVIPLINIINKVTSYAIQYSTSGLGSGYDNEYFSANLLKPGITLETVPAGTKTPTEQKYYQDAYNQSYLLPLYFVQEGNKEGYQKFRLYVDKKYVRDFFDYNYAYAHAQELGGEIIEGKGIPDMFFIETMTREEALIELIDEYYDIKALTVDATDTFLDTKAVIPTFARNRSILSRSDYFRPNDSITAAEIATIIYNIHKEKDLETTKQTDFMDINIVGNYPEWAKEAVQYVTYNNILSEKIFKHQYIDKQIVKRIYYDKEFNNKIIAAEEEEKQIDDVSEDTDLGEE